MNSNIQDVKRYLHGLEHTRVNEWLLFNANSAIFQLYHGENRLIYQWNDEICLFWIFIVLAHWYNSPQVDISIYSNTLFWFQANQSLLFLLSAVCLAKKQQIPILMSLVWHDRGSNPRYTTFQASILTITPPMRFYYEWVICFPHIKKMVTKSIKNQDVCVDEVQF